MSRLQEVLSIGEDLRLSTNGGVNRFDSFDVSFWTSAAKLRRVGTILYRHTGRGKWEVMSGWAADGRGDWGGGGELLLGAKEGLFERVFRFEKTSRAGASAWEAVRKKVKSRVRKRGERWFFRLDGGEPLPIGAMSVETNDFTASLDLVVRLSDGTAAGPVQAPMAFTAPRQGGEEDQFC